MKSSSNFQCREAPKARILSEGPLRKLPIFKTYKSISSPGQE